MLNPEIKPVPNDNQWEYTGEVREPRHNEYYLNENSRLRGEFFVMSNGSLDHEIPYKERYIVRLAGSCYDPGEIRDKGYYSRFGL